MTRRFIVRPRAERDIQSAYDWYESQEPGLGERFLEAVQKRLEAIHRMPRACPMECSRWLLAVRPATPQDATGLPRGVFHAVGVSDVQDEKQRETLRDKPWHHEDATLC